MKRFLIFLMIMLVALSSGTAFAGGGREKVTSDNYVERATSRLLGGIMNAGFSWIELIAEPINSLKHDEQNIANGVVDGIAKTVFFALVGTWDVATFWFPGEGGKKIAVKECVFADIQR
ncbi:MAG: hypothetical protein Q8R76_00815 [Candidatus Omnitrophota bacterium]|nr:hypothetical protein [Candidatus Omnitrophota bacterium]